MVGGGFFLSDLADPIGTEIGTPVNFSPGATHLTPIPGPTPAVAQETDTLSLALFDRVRVWAPEAGLAGREGTFHGSERGRFLFHTSRAQGARERTLPPGEIERVEVQRLTGNR